MRSLGVILVCCDEEAGSVVEVDVEAMDETSSMNSSSVSIADTVRGSDVGATSADVRDSVLDTTPEGAASAETSGAEVDLDEVVVDGCVVEDDGVRFFCFFDAGRRGHVCESCPTSLHLGQALSDPGQEANTLKPKMSKNRAAERGLPTGVLSTMSQRLVRREVPEYLCGATATISP
jgi:hypothetical protein